MFYKNLLFLALLIFTICHFLSCSNSLESNNNDIPYISLNVGDERQLVFTRDSSTIFYSVNGTNHRSDGLLVYSYAWYYGTNTIPDIQYYAIKDGFFVATELDTVKDTLYYIPDNPFREQRLAKLFPRDGDVWQSIIGDSTSNYFIATNIDTQHTFASTFNNCFSYGFSNFLGVIYSKGIGHIASVFLPDSSAYLASYIKVNNKIYGSRMPTKNPSFSGNIKKTELRKLYSFLLGQQ